MFESPYWSCSKFADWLRGTPKMYSASLEEWDVWTKKAKEKPIRYWLAEEGLDYLQDFIYYPFRLVRKMGGYINNRWITKTHALTSRLKRGEFHEFEARMLHALFDELVNFVEREQAWMQVICSEEEWKKYRGPWMRRLFRIRTWRSPAAGLAYLNWACSVKYDEKTCGKDSPLVGTPEPLALASQETLALYRWWKEERPKRPDPMEASGLSAYYEEQGEGDFWKNLNRPKKDQERWEKLSDCCNEIEQAYEDEDTAMMIRLIKIRKQLWI